MLQTLRISICVMFWLAGAICLPAVGQEVLPYHEDWAAGQGAWGVSNGLWQVGRPSYGPVASFSDSSCAGTNLEGIYPSYADSRLSSPPILLQRQDPGSPITLSFYHWFYMGANDTASVEIRIGDGSWERLPAIFRGVSEAWTRVAVDLTSFAGEQVQIGFRLWSDNYSVGPGWYVDDIRIDNEQLELPPLESFALGTGDWFADGGIWQIGRPESGPATSFSDSLCAGTDLRGAYPAYTDSRLVSPPVLLQRDLEDAPVTLSFRHWFWLAAGDTATVEVRVSGGEWEPVQAMFTGKSDVWTRAAIDLTRFAGAQVQLGFRLRADSYLEGPGWFVDDIRLANEPLEFPPLETFALGDGDWFADGGIWQIGRPAFGPASSFSDSLCAGTDLRGEYTAYTDSRLVSPPVVLARESADSPITLSFQHWFALGAGDTSRVEVRVSDGPWEPVAGPYTGLSVAWTQAGADLTDFAGELIQVGFRLRSDGYLEHAGWFVDDVAISGIGNVYKASIEFPTTLTGDSVSAVLTIPNYKLQTVWIEEFVVTGDADFALAPDVAESLPLEIAPSSSRDLPIVFAPTVAGGISDRAVVLGGAGRDTIATVDLGGSGRAIDYRWVSADFYPERVIDPGDPIQLAVEMADSVEVDSVLVHYRPAGAGPYSTGRLQLSVEDPVRDRYIGAVPADVAGAQGVEFYFTASNGGYHAAQPGAESPIVFRVNVAGLDLGEPWPAERYRMFTVPVELPNNTIIGTLSDDLPPHDITTWRMFRYVPADSGYVEYPDAELQAFTIGRAYWLVARDGFTLDTAPVAGVSTPADSAFALPLAPGWNQIGNPFVFPVAWDSVLVDGTPMSAAEGVLVERPVGWAVAGEYQLDVGPLLPFEGYWVKNVSEPPRTVVLQVPPREADPGGGDKGAGQGDWRLEIHASCAGAADRGTYLGFSADAATAWDRHDRSEPPPHPGRAVSVYFPHGSWPRRPGAYTSDIRPPLTSEPAGAGHRWCFDVAKSFVAAGGGDEVVLEFVGGQDAPPELEMTLLDREFGHVVDLGRTATYTFRLGRREPVSADAAARFVLLVGDAEYVGDELEDLNTVPAQTSLFQNHPNPFNPRTVLRWEVARAGAVELNIYDLAGALVKTVHSGFAQPGRYEYVWQGDDGGGRRVASGVYVYRLVAGETVRTRRMVLIR